MPKIKSSLRKAAVMRQGRKLNKKKETRPNGASSAGPLVHAHIRQNECIGAPEATSFKNDISRVSLSEFRQNYSLKAPEIFRHIRPSAPFARRIVGAAKFHDPGPASGAEARRRRSLLLCAAGFLAQ
jgi:hypothetical protein